MVGVVEEAWGAAVVAVVEDLGAVANAGVVDLVANVVANAVAVDSRMRARKVVKVLAGRGSSVCRASYPG